MNQHKEFFLQFLYLITVPSKLLQLLQISKESKLQLGKQGSSLIYASTYLFSHTPFHYPWLYPLLLSYSLVPKLTVLLSCL